MKKTMIAMCCAGLLMGCAPQSPTDTGAASNTYDTPHYKRVNLLVADLDRSLEIYQDILGFTPGNISESKPGSFSYPVFNIPRRARMRYTYLGEPGEARVLGLTEVKNVTLPKPASVPYMTASVIAVSNLKEKMAKIEALGLKTTESKMAGGTEFKFIEQAFVDYDGHLIVVYEILPE